MKHILITLILVTAAILSIHAQMKGSYYRFSDVMDERYGINIYEKLNFRLGGDSIRECKGYACKNWIRDYYTTGELLHNGFYVDGQLQNYKNYFPNGQLERIFKVLDDIRSTMTVYYSDGTLKSRVKYKKQYAQVWEDFHKDGSPEFYEEYDRKIEHIVAQRFYYDNGNPKTTMELVNKKKLIYDKKEYHSNGQVKAEGQLVYNIDMLDYQKTGTWKEYDEQGNQVDKTSF